MKRKTLKHFAILFTFVLTVFNFLPMLSASAHGNFDPGHGFKSFSINSNKLTDGELGDGSLKVNVHVSAQNDEKQSFNWTSNLSVYAIYVKEGPGREWYYYENGKLSGENVVFSKKPGTSHITFFYKSEGGGELNLGDPHKVKLIALPSVDPNQYNWRITNDNDVEVEVTYVLVGSKQTGKVKVAAKGTADFSTKKEGCSNKVKLFLGGVLADQKDCGKGKPEQPGNPVPGIDLKKIHLTSICSEDPTKNLKWRVSNENDKEVEVTYKVLGTNQTGKVTVAANSTAEFTTVTAHGANATKILLNGKTIEVKISTGLKCDVPVTTILTKIKLVLNNCLGHVRSATLVMKDHTRVNFNLDGGAAEVSQQLKYEDIESIELNVNGAVTSYKLNTMPADMKKLENGILTIVINWGTGGEKEDTIFTKIKLELSDCVGTVESGFVVLKNGVKLPLNNLFVQLAASMNTSEIDHLELMVNGKLETYSLSDLTKMTASIHDGVLTLKLSCNTGGGTGTTPTDPGTPNPGGGDGGVVIPTPTIPADPGTGTIPTPTVPADPGTGTTPTVPVDPGTSLPTPGTGTSPDQGGNDQGGIIIPAPATPGGPGTPASGNNNGTMTENQTPSGTKGWYFSMLPKTGDSSPIGYYLAGLFIILAGAVMLRAKKVKSE